MPTATDFKDYYQILGVSKTATPDEIKRAYRKLARQYHPDLNPGNREAEVKFKALNEAHEVLSDPDKRQKYDRFGQYWKQTGIGGSTPPRSAGVKTEGFDFDRYASFEEFVNDLLGRTNGGDRRTYTYRTGTPDGEKNGYGDRASAPGSDREATIALTFSEAFQGVQKQFQLSGETINVRIPAGAKPGSRVRVKGKGGTSPFSQQRGDLYLNIEVLPHPFFKFKGDRLICEVPIRPDEAVLGVPVQVPTPDGVVTMTSPPGVRSGQTLRLRGKGWVQPKGDRTDLLVKLQIVSPPELNDLEREYYEKIQVNSQFNPRAHLEEVKL